MVHSNRSSTWAEELKENWNCNDGYNFIISQCSKQRTKQWKTYCFTSRRSPNSQYVNQFDILFISLVLVHYHIAILNEFNCYDNVPDIDSKLKSSKRYMHNCIKYQNSSKTLINDCVYACTFTHKVFRPNQLKITWMG